MILRATILLLTGIFALGTAPLAMADLQLSVGGTTVSGTGGTVSYNGAVGNFMVNAYGFSNPVTIGPNMDLVQFHIATSTGGTLNLKLSDTDFSSPIGSVGTMAVSGHFLTGSGTITYSGALGNDNNVFSTETQIGTLTGLNGSTTGGYVTSNQFSLTEILTITLAPGSMLSLDSSIGVISVPEPDSILLLGLFTSFSLLCGLWFRKRKSTAAQ